jgi:hypothetical protein
VALDTADGGLLVVSLDSERHRPLGGEKELREYYHRTGYVLAAVVV